MRLNYASILTVLMTLSSFLFSCGNKNGDEKMGNIEFDSIMTERTVHLDGDTANPACNLKINITYPKKSSDDILTDSLNYFIVNTCFGERYAGLGVPEAMEQYTKDYIDNYQNDISPLFKADKESGTDISTTSGWYSYFRSVEGNVQHYEKSLLVYRYFYDEYTGGAHGMRATFFLNIDLATKRPLTLDDIFTGEYKESLTDLIWNQLMLDNDVKSHEELEEMGYGSTGEIAPVDNFYLDKNGITFYYNVYDIAPYAVGPIAVSLPYEILDRWLNTTAIIENLKER